MRVLCRKVVAVISFGVVFNDKTIVIITLGINAYRKVNGNCVNVLCVSNGRYLDCSIVSRMQKLQLWLD